MKIFSLMILCFTCCGFSSLIFEEDPYDSITGIESQLRHPEGVAFSPDGKYIAVTNAEDNSVTFYEFGRSNSPVFTLRGIETLFSYPHDVSFTPDGNYLAVGSHKTKCATIFRRDQTIPIGFYSTPIAIIKEQSFTAIGGVSYSPSENLLAIADTYSNRILIYEFEKENYQKQPSCVLMAPHLSKADGLNFSPDGSLLAATSHGNHKAFFFKRTFGEKELFDPIPVHVIEGADSGLKFPHSVAFHPTKELIAITSAGGKNDVTIYETFHSLPSQTLRIMDEASRSLIERKFPEEIGGKGVAFSSDGSCIAVCLPHKMKLDAVHFFRLIDTIPNQLTSNDLDFHAENSTP